MLISLLPAKKGLWTFVFTRKSKEEEYSHTGSKKLGCTAAVYMREIVFFPEYKVM